MRGLAGHCKNQCAQARARAGARTNGSSRMLTMHQFIHDTLFKYIARVPAQGRTGGNRNAGASVLEFGIQGCEEGGYMGMFWENIGIQHGLKVLVAMRGGACKNRAHCAIARRYFSTCGLSKCIVSIANRPPSKNHTCVCEGPFLALHVSMSFDAGSALLPQHQVAQHVAGPCKSDATRKQQDLRLPLPLTWFAV